MWCLSCLWYCKSTIFQANHNLVMVLCLSGLVVCDTAKVRFFKQITTYGLHLKKTTSCLWYCKSTIFQANHNVRRYYGYSFQLFVILQKYDFSSKSQPWLTWLRLSCCCLWYCKSTIFQANHNRNAPSDYFTNVVCDTAKVRFFKQITTRLRL